jgi:ankyrin repeat protein
MNRRTSLWLAAGLLMGGAGFSSAQSDAGRALRDAAAAGRTDEVRRLLASPAGRAAIDAADSSSQTALLLAIQNGRDEAAIALIEAGADVNAQATNQDTPWLLAGASGRVDALRRMVATGRVDYAKRNRFGGDALIPAADRGHVETVRFLLTESKVDVNHVNNLGWTALLEAVILGDGGPRHTEIVRLLVSHGAKVNLADKEGVTPLMHARQRRYAPIVAILEAAGAR